MRPPNIMVLAQASSMPDDFTPEQVEACNLAR
jgi:hypothetical protein